MCAVNTFPQNFIQRFKNFLQTRTLTSGARNLLYLPFICKPIDGISQTSALRTKRGRHTNYHRNILAKKEREDEPNVRRQKASTKTRRRERGINAIGFSNEIELLRPKVEGGEENGLTSLRSGKLG